MNGRVARILHLALVGGVVAAFVALALVRDLTDMTSATLPLALVRAAAFVCTGVAVTVHRVLWAILPAGRSGEDPDAWWVAHGGRALALWVTADGLAIAGAAFWFLTGDYVTLALAGGAGLLLLTFASPDRLAGS